MKLTKLLSCSLSGIRRKKGRTTLTIIGVTITIMLIVLNISMMKGFGEYYTSEMKAIGSNWLSIYPGTYEETPQGGWTRVAPEVYPLTLQDTENVSSVQHVVRASPVVESAMFLPEFNKSFALTGTTPEYFSIARLTLEEGGMWNESYTYEEGMDIPVVVGKDVGKTFTLNDRTQGVVNLTNYNFTVIGVLEHKVTPFFLPSYDKAVFIPICAAMSITGRGNKLHQIVVEVDNYENMNTVALGIKNTLKERHMGIEDFWVVSLADVIDLVDRQMAQWDIFDLIMNLFALLVAGVVILVVMIMAVTERKREIGIMRAVGAKRKHVLFIFLGEAGIIILTSYLIGCLLGFSLLYSIKAGLGGMFAFIGVSEIIIPSMVTAFYVCIPLCILFALYPAWKATKVSPIEAIRYE